MIKTIIFDFDGTLASTLEGIYACVCETFEGFGYPKPSVNDVRKTIGLTLEPALRQLAGFGAEDPGIGTVVKTYRDLYAVKAAAMTCLFPGALETLALLRSLGIHSMLVSNKSRQGLEHLTEHLRIKEHFDVILGADAVAFHKPDARLFTEGIVPVLAGSKAGEVLVVGDSESDLLFARNAGLKSCWASYGYGDPDRCRALEPDFVIEEISKVQDLARARINKRP